MTLYRIANWNGTYESHETRKLESLRYVYMPNKHDGLGFGRLAAQKNACELLACWVLLVQIASKGRKGQRGHLARDGVPLDADDLAVMTKFPAAAFARALVFFTDPKIGWLEASEVETASEMLPGFIGKPLQSPDNLPASPGEPGFTHAGIEGRKGEKEGMESPVPASPAVTAADIFAAYPRKQAKTDALKAISAAMKLCPPVDLLEKTTAYAAATSNWGESDRQFIPYPATWFNRGSYLDDPATWQRRATGTSPKPDRISFKHDDYSKV